MPVTLLSHWFVPSCPGKKASPLPHMPERRAHLFVLLQRYRVKLPLKIIPLWVRKCC